MTDSTIIPFCDVYCNAIRAVLAPGLIPLDPKDRDLVFGRAVGRVLAHELYHVFTATKHHGSRGVAQRAYSARDLFAEEFRFESGQVRKLHKALLSAFLQLAGELPRRPPPGLSIFVKSGCVGCHGEHGEGTPLGPTIHSMAKSYDSAKLAIRLDNRHTLMHERAQHLGTLWRPLAETDVENLATFLRALQKTSAECGDECALKRGSR